jgi:hypothetical protein
MCSIKGGRGTPGVWGGDGSNPVLRLPGVFHVRGSTYNLESAQKAHRSNRRFVGVLFIVDSISWCTAELQ